MIDFIVKLNTPDQLLSQFQRNGNTITKYGTVNGGLVNGKIEITSITAIYEKIHLDPTPKPIDDKSFITPVLKDEGDSILDIVGGTCGISPPTPPELCDPKISL